MDERIFYYVTTASGEEYIKKEAQYALRSLVNTGVSLSDIYVVVNYETDRDAIIRYVPELKLENIYIANIDLNAVKWEYMGGKRKFSFLKAAGLKKFFSKPKKDRHMVYFDTDVLFFKNPYEFLVKHKDRTWFHHGKKWSQFATKKNNGKPINPKSININNLQSLAKWVTGPCAYLMIKHGAKKLPSIQFCAGFYVLHPDDHAKLVKTTYKYCTEIMRKYELSSNAGDQKPMNAAINILDMDCRGGNKLECPEHMEYFDHYFGIKSRKRDFENKIKEIGCG